MIMQIFNNIHLQNVPSYPYTDLMEVMKSSDEKVNFADIISNLQVETLINGGKLDVRIGDSYNIIRLKGTLNRGEEGISELKDMAVTFVDGIKQSINYMSNDYKKFYNAVLDDYKVNGFIMPRIGTIIEPEAASGENMFNDKDIDDFTKAVMTTNNNEMQQ